jgi:hypothetical protein
MWLMHINFTSAFRFVLVWRSENERNIIHSALKSCLVIGCKILRNIFVEFHNVTGNVFHTFFISSPCCGKGCRVSDICHIP